MMVKVIKKSYLGHMNKFGNNVSPLTWRRPIQNHALDPLWKSIEQRDAPLQHRIVFQSTILRVTFEVLKLRR